MLTYRVMWVASKATRQPYYYVLFVACKYCCGVVVRLSAILLDVIGSIPGVVTFFRFYFFVIQKYHCIYQMKT